MVNFSMSGVLGNAGCPAGLEKLEKLEKGWFFKKRLEKLEKQFCLECFYCIISNI